MSTFHYRDRDGRIASLPLPLSLREAAARLRRQGLRLTGRQDRPAGQPCYQTQPLH